MSTGPADAADAPLTLRTSVEANATVVQCTGKIVAGLAGPFRDEVKALIPSSKKIVLDLTGVTQMDSMGLGTVVGLYVSAKAGGCTLVLINLNQRIRDLFRITNVWSLFDVYAENIVRMP